LVTKSDYGKKEVNICLSVIIEIEDIFKKVAEHYCNDGVKFNPLSVSSERIKEKPYFLKTL